MPTEARTFVARAQRLGKIPPSTDAGFLNDLRVNEIRRAPPIPQLGGIDNLVIGWSRMANHRRSRKLKPQPKIVPLDCGPNCYGAGMTNPTGEALLWTALGLSALGVVLIALDRYSVSS